MFEEQKEIYAVITSLLRPVEYRATFDSTLDKLFKMYEELAGYRHILDEPGLTSST